MGQKILFYLRAGLQTVRMMWYVPISQLKDLYPIIAVTGQLFLLKALFLHCLGIFFFSLVEFIVWSGWWALCQFGLDAFSSVDQGPPPLWASPWKPSPHLQGHLCGQVPDKIYCNVAQTMISKIQGTSRTLLSPSSITRDCWSSSTWLTSPLKGT